MTSLYGARHRTVVGLRNSALTAFVPIEQVSQSPYALKFVPFTVIKVPPFFGP
jgi:hypothetical protein